MDDLEGRIISIHSLYAEGDKHSKGQEIGGYISIHSLYAEGDGLMIWKRKDDKNISIHSLYAEGDWPQRSPSLEPWNFNPLPLRRGRPLQRAEAGKEGISIHSLYAEGDAIRQLHWLWFVNFNPLPLRRGRHSYGDEESMITLISIHSLYAEGDRF